MVRQLAPQERLIVAPDFDPRKEGCIDKVRAKVLSLGEQLAELGVYIKVNSILRAIGYSLIIDLQDMGLKVFADLKLVDIPTTMDIDAAMLAEVRPGIVTVMCSAGIDGMRRVRKTLGSTTEVLGVSVLTSMDDEDCDAIFSCSTKVGVLRLAHLAQEAGLPGLILSSQEAELIKEDTELLLGLNTPGIRPEWSIVGNDDQKRVLTPAKAIKAGADRLVMGRPITLAENPRDAVLRTIEEIAKAV